MSESESESENESDLDFSASEDEYIPPADSDTSDDDETGGDTEADDVVRNTKILSRSQQKQNPRKQNEEGDDDSDSSVENYLVNPNEIDLASDFFNPNKIPASAVPSFDCNIGLNLSNSDEEEVFDEVPSTSRDATAKLLDFKNHEIFNKDLERAKDQLRKFKSTNFGQDNCNDVTKLLAMGESSLVTSPTSKLNRRKDVMSSDESDFEEVEVVAKTHNKNDVEVRIGPTIKQKPDKKQAEIEASIKRRINRRKKEDQLMMHKVHLLSWIAYGNFVNKVLNSTKLMQMVVKYIPSEKCYPKEQTDQQYFEQIIKWYLKTMGLKNKEQNCTLKCLPPLPTSLALQIQSKMAICKKDYLFIFIILLRSIGIQCRLIINLATVPIRPPAKDLCVISLKNPDDTKKANKSTKQNKSSVEKRKETNVKIKDSKPMSKGDKLKRGSSISGEVSKITTKTPEQSSEKKSLKSKLQAAVKSTEEDTNKKMLKRRSVSVQDTSSVNTKRSRATILNGATSKVSNKDSNNDNKTGTELWKEVSQKLLKRRSLSLQSPTSVNTTSKRSSNQPVKISKPADIGVITESPICRRTRRGLAKRASSIVPQFDGGDDTKTKKGKPQLSKLKEPIRSRSVSPSSNVSSNMSQSVTRETGKDQKNNKKSKPDLLKIRLPPRSQSVSKSPTSLRRSKSVTTEGNVKNMKKVKPNLFRIRLPSRSRSESRSPSPLHTSKRSNSVIKSSSKDSSPEKPSSKSGKANLDKGNPSSRSTSVEKIVTTEGNDKIKKKAKPNLFRIRLPSRSRSPSPLHTSKRSNSVIKSSSKDSSPEKPSSKSGKANLDKVKPSSRSTSVEKTQTATSQRASRRQKFEKSISTDPSTPSLKSLNNSKNDFSEVTALTAGNEKILKEKPSTSKSATLTKPTSPLTSPVKSFSVSNLNKKISSKETTKATISSTSKTAALSNSKTKASSTSGATASASSKPTASSTIKPTVSPTKVVSTMSTKPNPKTKSVKSVPTTSETEISTKKALKHKSNENISYDSDFAPTPKKKLNLSASVEKPLPKAVEKLKKRIDRRVLSTDDESIQPSVKKNDMNYWIEVYCEADSKWICIDLFKLKVNAVDEVKKKATKPIAYVFGWNNNNSIKDVSPRYCSDWNTTTRKLRVSPDWLDEAFSHYKEPISQRCVAEDRELEEIHSKVPIPKSISELKNHPLYVLPRHLLKFEGIYPPNPVPVAYIRDEPIYSRLCVHTLHSREIWVKQARVVKPGEIPYKIVKARPKWDRLANKMLECQPLEIFGYWQTQPYEPPVAENGVVPRNQYGNVELFKPEMLPKNTVHLRLPGLNRVCAKLKIDCAQAVVGFDFHGGSSHPTFDGFVVCEEFQELVTMTWWEEQAEAERKSKEKHEKRVYDNWKKLIKGLLIRERLQRKYNFAGKNATASSSKKE